MCTRVSILRGRRKKKKKKPQFRSFLAARVIIKEKTETNRIANTRDENCASCNDTRVSQLSERYSATRKSNITSQSLRSNSVLSLDDFSQYYYSFIFFFIFLIKSRFVFAASQFCARMTKYTSRRNAEVVITRAHLFCVCIHPQIFIFIFYQFITLDASPQFT